MVNHRVLGLSATALLWGCANDSDSSDSGVDGGTTGNTSGVPTSTDATVNPATDGGASSGGATGETGNGSTGGDAEFCVALDELPIECETNWYTDGECDPVNNVDACTFDGGDCCDTTCTDGEFACGSYGFDCRDPAAGGNDGQRVELIGDPCAPIADPFDAAAMEAEVALLSSDELGGRRPGFHSDAVMQRYIEERFECLGLAPVAEGCHVQAFANDDGDRTANIIGVIEGSDPAVADEIIVVGAHHDHLGVLDGEIHNGANDNVSGVVALFAIAQEIQSAAAAPRRTIVFIAFGSEETGLEGAVYYANNAPPELPIDNVVYMVNLDMLGTYDVVQGVDAFGTFDGTPGRAILDDVLQAYPDLDVTRGFASPEGDSDYDPFCDEGIPYVYFETFDPPCWHEPCDDTPRMDFPHMSELARIKHDVVLELANTATDLVAARADLGCARGPEAQTVAHKSHRSTAAIVAARSAPNDGPRIKQRARHRRTHAQER